MAFSILPNDLLQFTYVGQLYGQTVMTIWNYKYTGVSTLTDGEGYLSDVVDAMQTGTGLYNQYRAVMPTAWISAQIWAQKIYPLRYRKLTFVPTNDTGANPGLPTSAADAAALLLHASLAGRRNQCVKHLPGVERGSTLNGILTAAAQDAYNLVALSAIQTIEPTAGLTIVPIIFSRKSPTLSPVITGGAIQDTVRTQRRRVVRRGI